ncbi:probable methionone aminopeptidase, partial [Thalassiosira pseudonana CCMP1335]
VLIHDADSIAKMRKAAQLARKLLDYACHPSIARAGTTTEQIDSLIHDAALANSAYPSPLNYMGFPKSLCSSVNEVVCHGIPDTRRLELGDVVSFDVSCFVGGVHGDNCATIVVGDVNDEFVTARRLVQAALESRDEGVRACKPGGCLSDIGSAIHAVADAYGYDTVRHYRGHGISSDFHCAPYVKHYRNNEGMELIPGMIFTIEPMLTEGMAECDEWSDNWTVVTKDGGRAAQFEHTVLITDTGVEVLTVP